MYLLDTNICIYALKLERPVLRKLQEHGSAQIAISSLVAAELAYGVENSQKVESNRSVLEDFLQELPVLPWPEAAMWHYARHRKKLKALGTPIGEMDLLIACHAVAADMTLVTNNTREFERIEGLKLENWIG